jgi:ferric-chelate reductase
VAAIIMGVTSLPYVRSRYFNTFFTMHHLYLIFFAFYVFHVDWNHVGQSMGPIFLFFIDRFLRMMQSRRQVTGVSAQILPSGLVELKIPKQPGKYDTHNDKYL